jgi:hypothetical protein
MRTRSLLSASALLASLLLSAGPAVAKLPPWTCELSTTQPLVGERVRVDVRYWEDAAHTEPAAWVSFRRLRDLLEARALVPGAQGMDRPGVLTVTLASVGPGVYRGHLVFPDTRPYRVRGCGGGSDPRGYPRPLGVVVRPRPLVDDAVSSDRVPAIAASVASAAVLFVLGLITGRRARRRPTAPTAPPFG